jgi:hypothetical protein
MWCDPKSKCATTSVVLLLALGVSVAAICGTTQGAEKKPASADRQIQSLKNLQKIGLALIGYMAVNKGYPSAVMYGPDGKTPHSWRVAVLPYLDQADLYKQYKFDEPWDSENNKKVLAQMPPVFRDPNDPADSTNSSYFVFTGPETLFPDRERSDLPDIKDGIDSTLLVIEAKRDIPWTKPEDIPYAADKPVPKLGGHHRDVFMAVFCTGMVKPISTRLDEKKLRALITKAGGESIEP